MKGVPSLGTLNPIVWHGHEMLFGFAAAVIAGFALTAMQNWTGLDWTTLAITLAVLPGFLSLGKDPILAPLLLAAAVLNVVRLPAWRPWGTLRVPLLWVPHVGYLWLPIGFALRGAHLAQGSAMRSAPGSGRLAWMNVSAALSIPPSNASGTLSPAWASARDCISTAASAGSISPAGRASP